MTSKLPAVSSSCDAGRADRHALGWMVVSCMLFAIVMVALRMLLHDLPPTQPAFLRYVVGIGLLMPFVGRQIPQIWRSLARVGFLARGILHAIAVSFWFYSIKVIPLADVNAILNLGPVWATIGAALFLGERLRLRRIMAILVSFAGAMIIIKPGFSDIVPGTWAVMVTAAFFAFSYLIAKQLKAHHDDNLIIMALSVTIARVALPLAIVVWQPISPLNWLGVFVIGLAATLGHMSLMRSFAGPMWASQAGKYVQLLFVILFGITLFDEKPTLSTLAGAMVVLSAVTYIAMREGRRRKGDGMAEGSQADDERQGSR